MLKKAPENVEFLGQLDKKKLKEFYQHSRVIVLPSKWYEGLPAVIIQAMLNAKPVICSDLGGLPEIVSNEKTGLLFKHNDVKDFSDKILQLWNNNLLCEEYGNAAREKVIKEYHPDIFYERLINSFNQAIANKNSS